MKKSMQDLALSGGSPAFADDRCVGKPNTGVRERFLERIGRVLDSGWLTNRGVMMREFEENVARVAGVRHCVSTCNATVALELLADDLLMDGARPGDEVIVPTLTFTATAHAVARRGLRPVFADVDPVTGLIDPGHVEALTGPRTRAVLGVQLWGQTCDVDRLEKITQAAGLRLFFDSAHGLGCTHRGRPLGGFGHAEVFSFHATKIVNCFEGGAVVTDDDDLADRLRAAREFGRAEDGVRFVGTNAKMNEASAAMGLTSLEGLSEAVERNRECYEEYRRLLADVPGVTVQVYDPADSNNHHYMIVKVAEEEAGVHRDVLLGVLRAENVVAQPYFCEPLHRMAPYREQSPARLPHAELLAERLLALPTGPSMAPGDVEKVCDVIRFAAAHGSEVTERWRAVRADSTARR
jgi:dTDP-4-amino-4,6-dideoxyglucose